MYGLLAIVSEPFLVSSPFASRSSCRPIDAMYRFIGNSSACNLHSCYFFSGVLPHAFKKSKWPVVAVAALFIDFLLEKC